MDVHNRPDSGTLLPSKARPLDTRRAGGDPAARQLLGHTSVSRFCRHPPPSVCCGGSVVFETSLTVKKASKALTVFAMDLLCRYPTSTNNYSSSSSLPSFTSKNFNCAQGKSNTGEVSLTRHGKNNNNKQARGASRNCRTYHVGVLGGSNYAQEVSELLTLQVLLCQVL